MYQRRYTTVVRWCTSSSTTWRLRLHGPNCSGNTTTTAHLVCSGADTLFLEYARAPRRTGEAVPGLCFRLAVPSNHSFFIVSIFHFRASLFMEHEPKVYQHQVKKNNSWLKCSSISFRNVLQFWSISTYEKRMTRIKSDWYEPIRIDLWAQSVLPIIDWIRFGR